MATDTTLTDTEQEALLTEFWTAKSAVRVAISNPTPAAILDDIMYEAILAAEAVVENVTRFPTNEAADFLTQ